ncbi:MAG TPA: NAD(P)/FAD-dependent oxidoreductase [Terriglobales bacterium]|nr:NAD(P)/FAD-dependent oxidoreductase [Terriglobales bacterium]
MSTQYDLILVGGGLGGSTLARHMALKGARVLLVERELKFKDRVRGEFLVPWGTAEAKQLGVLDLLDDRVAHEVPWVDFYSEQSLMVRREMPATTPQGLPCTSFFHPEMQEVLIASAESAGAHVRRGASVANVRPGSPARVTINDQGQSEELSGRLVVGADGRSSTVRSACGFAQQRDPEDRMIAGILLDNVSAREDTGHIFINSRLGQTAAVFPQGNGRVRAYFCYGGGQARHQGTADVAHFIDACKSDGAHAAFFDGAVAAGPLAAFSAAQTWVEHPYRDGVTLIGDAAAASDPSWGQGLALTLRDVRVLADHLRAAEDWDAAAHAYALEHDRYIHVMHMVDNWYTQFYLATGPAADERRARAMPLIGENPMRQPDHMFSGPEMPFSEEVRKIFFAEEDATSAGATWAS